MKRLMVVIGAVVAAWFLVLICLSMLGIVAAIAMPNLQRSRAVAPTPDYVPGDGVTLQMNPAQPAASQIVFDSIKSTGLDPELTMLIAGLGFLAVVGGAFSLAWRYTGRQVAADDGGGQAVQELHRQAQELTHRMETLETILLDRVRSLH